MSFLKPPVLQPDPTQDAPRPDPRTMDLGDLAAKAQDATKELRKAEKLVERYENYLTIAQADLLAAQIEFDGCRKSLRDAVEA